MSEATLTQREREFLTEPNVGTVTTLRRDGSPHSTVVWVDVDDEGVLFNTAIGRAKERYLRADPRVSVLVLDPEDVHRWLAVDGTVELSTEGAREHIDRLHDKYVGPGSFHHLPGEQRVIVRIRAERIESHGLG
jgi:PPOX class probable F420-dependent enzyme